MNYKDYSMLNDTDLDAYLISIEQFLDKINRQIVKLNSRYEQSLNGGYKNINSLLNCDVELKELNLQKIELEEIIYKINKKKENFFEKN